jgi:hypothetical protein
MRTQLPEAAVPDRQLAEGWQVLGLEREGFTVRWDAWLRLGERGIIQRAKTFEGGLNA